MMPPPSPRALRRRPAFTAPFARGGAARRRPSPGAQVRGSAGGQRSVGVDGGITYQVALLSHSLPQQDRVAGRSHPIHVQRIPLGGGW